MLQCLKIFNFKDIHDFQIVTKASHEICFWLNIQKDTVKRLQNLKEKFHRINKTDESERVDADALSE